MATNPYVSGALNTAQPSTGALSTPSPYAGYAPTQTFDQYKAMMGYTGKKPSKTVTKSLMQGYQGQIADERNMFTKNIDQVNPSGSIKYTTDPVTGKLVQTTELNPEAQAAYDAQNRITAGRSNAAADMLGGVTKTLGTPLDWGQMPTQVRGAPGSPTFGRVGSGPDLQTDFGSIDPMALAGLGNVSGGSAAVERAKEYELQKELDYSGLGAMPEANDETRQRVEDAMFQRAKSRLDPQWEQTRREALDRRYAMGQREGDQSFDLTEGVLGRNQNDAYNQAIWDSITKGGEEQSRLFGLEMAKRQQGKSEIDTQGNFKNSALMNQFEQGARNAQFQNAANIANAGFATQAGIASAGNRMQGALAGLDYNRQGDVLGNAAKQTMWGNELAGTGFNNDVGQREFGNALQSQDQQMKIREQAIQDALRERYTGLNEMNALLSGQQVNPNPSFQNYNTTGGASGPNTYDAYMAQKTLDAQNKQAMIGAVGSIGGGIGSAIPFSDARLKSNIVRIGTTPGGYGWYEYDIFGRREQGVMAQEVPAEWTVLDPSGFLRVNYSKVQ
jgi:hypothetical protein